MINRILIRIKVVQLLYSYLLTRSEFKIQPAPDKKTRDSRYAYSLYIDLLMMMAKFSGLRVSPSDTLTLRPATDNKLFAGEVGKALISNSEMRDYVVKNELNLNGYDKILQHLADAISDSAACREYSRKRSRKIEDEIDVWCTMLESVVANDNHFKEVCRANEDFTLEGFGRAIKMAIETLRNYSDEKTSLISARKSLRDSLDKAYDLYKSLLLLPIEITAIREEQIEAAKEKYLPTADDLNPNLKFINNRFVESLRNCEQLEKEIDSPLISRREDYFTLKKLLEEILASELYRNYVEAADDSLEADCEFWRNALKDIVFQSDEFNAALENKSIYWNDDLAVVGQFVLKTIRRTGLENHGLTVLMPQFKDDADAKFGEELFTYAVRNYKSYRKHIDSFINSEQWDSERIALMDIVILTAAIAEILNFPIIPVPVSINEFVEIANYYSTSRSGQFVNGILYSVINKLRADGQLHKPF